MFQSLIRTFFTSCLLCAVPVSQADELVFNFVDPVFGGNSLNGNYLIALTGAQNNQRNPDAFSLSSQSALGRAQSLLQSRLTSQLLNQIGRGELNEGRVKTDDLEIEVHRGDNGQLSIRLTDLIQNETSVIEFNDKGF